MTKYHENLLRDNTLSNISIAKIFFILGSPDDAENPKWNLFMVHPISQGIVFEGKNSTNPIFSCYVKSWITRHYLLLGRSYHAKMVWVINVRFFLSSSKLPTVLFWVVPINRNIYDQLQIKGKNMERCLKNMIFYLDQMNLLYSFWYHF